jgi:hypothetical protein
MRRFFFFLVILILAIPIHAQDTEPPHACTSGKGFIQGAINRDIDSDCTIYNACQAAGEAYCYLKLILANMEACEDADNECLTEAKLLGIAFELYEHPYISVDDLSYYDFTEAYNLIPRTLTAFVYGDMQRTIEIYQEINNLGYSHPLAYAGMASVEAYLGQNEAALEHYRQAMNELYFEAPLYWFRGESLLAMGKPDEATFDAFLFAHLVSEDEELTAFAAEFSLLVPLDESAFEDWNYYPLESIGISPGGNTITDYSYVAASPIRLLILDDAILMQVPDTLEIEISDWMILDVGSRYGEAAFSTYFGENYYSPLSWIIGANFTETGDLNLLVQPYVFEAGIRYDAVLRPAGQADPRPQEGDFRCTATSPRSRLLVGTSVYAGEFGFISYSTDANIDNTVYEQLDSIEVLAGPVCIDNALWYWAKLGGLDIKAWVLEAAETGAYAFDAYSPGEPPVICNPALRPRFSVGVRGFVVPTFGANNLRAEPNSSSAVIGEMPPNAEFTIVGEPVCAENLTWWQVDYQGTIAWTAEGENGVYWLEPSQNQE